MKKLIASKKKAKNHTIPIAKIWLELIVKLFLKVLQPLAKNYVFAFIFILFTDISVIIEYWETILSLINIGTFAISFPIL